MTISKLFLIMVVLIISVNGYGQSIWCKIYGGPRTDQNFSILKTKDNNVIATGQITVFSPYLSMYIWQTIMTKFDINGNILWQKIIGDSLFSNFTLFITEDQYGNLFVPVNREYPYLYKLDQNGNILWSRQYSDTAISQWYDIKFYTDSNYIIMSAINQDLAYKISLIEIDTTGNILKYKILSSEDSTHAYHGGKFRIYNNDIFIVYNKSVSYVEKYNLNFEKIWRIDIPSGYLASDIENISNRSFIGLGFMWASPIQMYIFKFDIYGNLLWQNTYDSLYYDKRIIKTLNNNIATVGRGIYDTAKFAILDTMGNVIKHVKQPSVENTVYYYEDIAQMNDSGYVIAGYFHNSEYSDCIVVKTDKDGNTIPLSVKPKIIIPKDFSVLVYPNPFNSQTTIEINSIKNKIFSLNLFNLLGQEVYKIDKKLEIGNKNKFIIDFKELNLPSSIYFLQISGENLNVIKKLIYLK